ncbi:MAG: TetR/AcrR family transcriptional regulator [Lachnospiraceae bacterium]
MENKNKRSSPANLLAKECIVSALLKLIYIKPLSSITISELCEKAGVSRMTFYRNFSSKEEIFTNQLSEIFAEYANDDLALPENGIFYDKAHLIHFFTSLSKYKEFFDGLMFCGFGLYFLKMMNVYLIEKWSDQADSYRLIAFSGALYNTFFLWSSNGYRQNPEELAEDLAEIFSNHE